MFSNQTILLGVTGGIAAFKAAQLASDLSKTGAQIHVLMTKNATEFIAPLTFEELTKNRVSVDTFDRNFQYNVQHISLAKKADVFLVAPASANVIAKFAAGIADDMLTTTFLAASCPKLIAPAMNTAMYENPITQRNLEMLRGYGMQIVEPASGLLACGDVGNGKLADLDTLFEAVAQALTKKDLSGLRILVTAGPTREAIDPVRFISNHSSGHMGYAVAQMAARRGAAVTLVSGPTALKAPMGVHVIPVGSAQEMFRHTTESAPDSDMIIKCAAVADYRPATVADDKIKKTEGDASIALARTKDILAYLGEHRAGKQVLCGFSMETKDMLKNSQEKLARKHLDMMVANNLKDEGAGFAVDTNRVTFITPDSSRELPLMSKADVANALLDELLAIYRQKQGRQS